ncbi:MAG: hypothetical protein JO025_28570 [Verrucomicrobia bacterium]|nr:hypothetical protein [Verrucomicrobiota bacterium]
MNRIGCSINREVKVARDPGAFYLQRSICSIELRFEEETEVFIAVDWHTGAKLLGRGRKEWKSDSLAKAIKELREYTPSPEVPYPACLMDILAQLPLNVVKFSLDEAGEIAESASQEQTDIQRSSSAS